MGRSKKYNYYKESNFRKKNKDNKSKNYRKNCKNEFEELKEDALKVCSDIKNIVCNKKNTFLNKKNKNNNKNEILVRNICIGIVGFTIMSLVVTFPVALVITILIGIFFVKK
ncbi:MAG: hypothetical protein ACRC57_01215 [Sarcina sp.]